MFSSLLVILHMSKLITKHAFNLYHVLYFKYISIKLNKYLTEFQSFHIKSVKKFRVLSQVR